MPQLIDSNEKVEKVTVQLTLDGSGAASVDTTLLDGEVHAVEFVPGTWNALAAITVERKTGGLDILTAVVPGASRKIYLPRTPICGAAGTDLEYASTFKQVDKHMLSNEALTVVVSGGTAANTATVNIFLK